MKRIPYEIKYRGRGVPAHNKSSLVSSPRTVEIKSLSTELKPLVIAISNSKFIPLSYTLLETYLERENDKKS